MERVRRIGSDLCVATRGVERQRGQGWIVIAVDDVVRETGMIGLLGKNFLQDGAGLFLIGVGFVSYWRVGAEGQGVENLGFAILRVARLEVLHGLFIGQRARVMIQLVGVFIENFDGSDVVAFALRFDVCGLGALDCGPASLQIRGCGRVPELAIVRHRYAPFRHAAGRVLLGDSGKGFGGFLIPEGMKHCYGAIEIGLNGGEAGGAELDAT